MPGVHKAFAADRKKPRPLKIDVMLLNIYDEKDDILKIEGRLIGPNMISLSEIDDNSEESEDILFLLRESYVPELRKKAKNIIKEIQEKNT